MNVVPAAVNRNEATYIEAAQVIGQDLSVPLHLKPWFSDLRINLTLNKN